MRLTELTTRLMAQGDGLDFQSVGWLVVVILSVLGGLLGKKKQDKQQKNGPTPPTAPTPRRPDTPVKPTHERPKRPQRLEPVRGRPVEVGTSTPAPAERRRPLVVRTPETYPREQREWLEQQRRLREQREADEAGAAAAEAEPVPAAVIRPVVGAKRRRAGVVGDRLVRMLANREDLRAGVVLSELLSPPVALRPQHLRF